MLTAFKLGLAGMLRLADLGVAAYIVEQRPGPEYHFVEINDPAARLWTGQPNAQLGPMALTQAFPPAVAVRVAQSYTACISEQKAIERDSTVPVPHGTITVRTSLYPLAKLDGGPPRLLGLVTDVTQERRVHDELVQANARLAVTMEALGGIHWFYDAPRRSFDLSPSFNRLLGRRFKPVMTLEEWLDCVHPDDRHGPSFADRLDDLGEGEIKEFRLQTDSETRWVRCHRRPVRNDWAVIGVAGVIIDITADRQRELNLSAQASSDALTGLGNRRRLKTVLEAEARQPSPDLSLLMIDVDQFKAFNDLYGHLAGDIVLKRIAEVLQALVEPIGGTAIRSGGEEFILVLPNVNAAAARCTAIGLLENIRALQQPHAASDIGVVSISVGVASRSDLANFEDLVAKADAALYAAKRTGRNCFRVADATTGVDLARAS